MKTARKPLFIMLVLYATIHITGYMMLHGAGSPHAQAKWVKKGFSVVQVLLNEV